jgi:thiamine-phosphate pyrophosphorylase
MNVVCISNRRLCHGDFLSRLESVSRSGVESIYLREKDLPQEEYQALLESVLKACTCDVYAVQYVDVAKSLNVKSIHLSYGSFLEEYQTLENFNNISVSVHSIDEAIKAQSLGATRLVTGHIFATDCKKGLPPRGVEYLKSICESVSIPVYAIGGITPENAHETMESGASGVCVMSSLMQSDSFDILIKTLKSINF